MTRFAYASFVLASALVFAAGCGNSKVTQSSGAAACVTASGCGILTGISTCTQFIAYVNDPLIAGTLHISPDQVNCIANAGSDCAAAKRCLGNGSMPASCSGNAKSCIGDQYQECTLAAGSGGNMGLQLYNCASVGKMCVTNGGNTDCGYG